MKPISDSLYDLLMSQGIANGRAATQASRGNTASSGNALSFMDWANAQIDREGDVEHSPAGGRGRRMGNSGKGTGTRAPAKSGVVGNNIARDPSPAMNRPVLQVIDCKDGRRQTPRVAPLSLRPSFQLIIGGKA